MAPEPAGIADRLLDAMAGSAARRYGAERVSELTHALQCAELAQAAGADDELTLACLLHDYLCSTEPDYHALSPASRHTLTLQGGPMGPEEIARHAAHPWFGDALRLRRWDDLAKVVGKETAPLAAWAPLLRAHVR
jgi:predicted HD phosphohydrolase